MQHDERKATVYQDDDGMWVVTARLPAVEGEMVAKAIAAIVDRQDEELRDKGASTEDIAKKTFPRGGHPRKL